MNRLVASALLREAVDGAEVLVIAGSPRTTSTMFALLVRETEKTAATSALTASVLPHTEINIEGAGTIRFAVAGQPATASPTLVYADMLSIARALGDDMREIDMLLRPFEVSGAEVVRSEGDS